MSKSTSFPSQKGTPSRAGMIKENVAIPSSSTRSLIPSPSASIKSSLPSTRSSIPSPSTRSSIPSPSRTTYNPDISNKSFTKKPKSSASIKTKEASTPFVTRRAVLSPSKIAEEKLSKGLQLKISSVKHNSESLFRSYVPQNIDELYIIDLLKLKYNKQNKFIIDIERRDIILEIIGMLLYQPAQDVIDFLIDAPNPGYVLWDQLFMNEGKISIEREITIQQAEEVGVKGVGKCRYCSSNELVFAQKQLSSGDEAMKVFVRCVACQKSWRQ